MTSHAATHLDLDLDLETLQPASPRLATAFVDPPDAPGADTAKQASTESIVDPFLSPNPHRTRFVAFSPSLSVRTIDAEQTPKVGSRAPGEFRSLLLVEIQKQQRIIAGKNAKGSKESLNPSSTPLPASRPSTTAEETFSAGGDVISFVAPVRSSNRSSRITSHRPSVDGSWDGEEDLISRYLNGGITGSCDSVVNLGLGMRADRVVSSGTFGASRRESTC